MIEFQKALTQILSPMTTNPELSSKPALVCISPEGKERIVTYKELENLINKAQAGLTQFGIGMSDLVMMCSPNSPELVATILASWRLGAIALPVDFRLTPGELENIAEKSKAKVLFSPKLLSSKVKTITPDHWPSTISQLPLHPDLNEKSPALVILTSGTTGIPKGAVHSLDSLINNVSEVGGEFGLSNKDCAFLPLPVSHIFGIEVMLAFLLFRGQTVFSDFNPATFWGTVDKLHITLIVGVPTIYSALMHLPSPPSENIPVQFYVSGGAPLPVSLNDDFKKRFQKPIVQGYGTTETKVLSFNKEGPPGSVGRPLPSVKVDIVGAEGQSLRETEQGEIVVSGPSLMTEYLNQPEITSQVLCDGRYFTGDLGYTENNYIFISGRSKELIIVAGNKIFPIEVETVLRQHPLAGEVAVIGVPHTKLGQIVKAIIVVNDNTLGQLLLEDEDKQKSARQELTAKFRAFCQEHLKRELRPMDWEFRPLSHPLPKTLTGKIDKKVLEAAAV